MALAAALLFGCKPEETPGNGEKPEPSGVFTVTGKVTDYELRPLDGVVVSDGLKSVRTGTDGVYQIDSDLGRVKFISVSTPSGYEPPVNGGVPVFYKKLSECQKVGDAYVADFSLKKISSDADRYTLLISADPQPRSRTRGGDKLAYHSLDCCSDLYRDMKEYASSISGQEVHGICLGDIVHEDMSLYGQYIEGMRSMGFPTYNVIGNHDNDTSAEDDEQGRRIFEEHFGPCNYSFNLGRIHYVVVDNLIMKKGSSGLLNDYSEGLTDDVWEWLQGDLALVDRSSTVMLCTHAPAFREINGSDKWARSTCKHGNDYASLLAKYKTVYAWAGHTHQTFNYIYPSGHGKFTNRLECHTLPRSTGELYTNEYLADGTPRGYLVVTVDGEDVSWKWKPLVYQSGKHCGTAPDFKFRAWEYKDGVAYIGNDRLDESHQIGTSKDGDYVYANVYMWDSEWETPKFNGQAMSKAFETYDRPQKEIWEAYKDNSYFSRYNVSYTLNSEAHPSIFRFRVSGAKGKGTVTVTDRFGVQYSSKIEW